MNADPRDTTTTAESTTVDTDPATIVVTARPLNDAFEVNVGAFGDKDPLDVPLAIQLYDAEVIRSITPRTVRDVLVLDPAVQSSAYGGGFDNFRLRGFAMDNFNTIRRDGLALAPHYDMPVELVERIDVLKGPSGFLYGFNSPGGTINYISKRPTRDPFATVTVRGSTLRSGYVALDASGSTLGGALGVRINAGHEKVGGFDHLGDLERSFVGVAADVRLGERALLQLNADWARKSNMSDPLLRADQSPRADPLDPATYILPPRIDRRDSLSPSWYRHRTEAYNVEGKFDYDLGGGWTSITQANYSQVNRHGGYMDLFDIRADGAIGRASLYQSRGEVFTTWSVQSYLLGRFDIGPVSHQIFAGASHRQFRDKSPFWDFIESGNGIPVSRISVGNVLRPVQPPSWNFGPRNTIEFHSRIEETSIFASDLIRLTPQFEVLLGGRNIWYKARDLSATAAPQDRTVFVPTGAVLYRPARGVMAYGSYSRGLEKGDYAPFNAVNANQPTGTIESNQVELGFKATLREGLNAGIALFRIERDASYLNGANVFVNDGRFRHRGVEVDINGQVTSDLTILGGLAFLDTRLRDVIDPTTLDKRSEGAPRWKWSLGARHAITAAPGLSVDTLVNYVGRRPVDAQNSGFVPRYATWDAGIAYDTRIGGTPVNVRLHGKNLTNAYYYPGVSFGGLDVGRTREVFLSAATTF
ncbi:TonB-dependent siderophore receptor [Sphingomonas sp. 2R-10]|uniref:TonB-dependent receptor n=1 Tax=Sphingomonas sp. 2R-10 TaxID=3045148 RepID=UPI0013DD9F38|nr:TonB-dependent siderophore receptor [Sphingomonas sp. 2R-10]MDJ0275270.1 TonB-dependent siderophore receptor [Sphingomonas sp. 2R-10]